jgi:mannose-6-phosphate isomerase-like protein (cupin superfamily)
MKNYTKIEREEGARIELHDKLGLTGSEISVNILPANASVPFVHAHKENEEVYYIVNGDGKFVIDGEDVVLKAGDFVKVAPKGKRQLFAGENGITYICIQTKENSLEEYTANDAIIG